VSTRVVTALFLCLCGAGTGTVRGQKTSTPASVNVGLAKIREVYVTGAKKHEVSWARKRLGRFTCLEPVKTPAEADAILDLEPVEAAPLADVATGPTGVVTCVSHSGANRSVVACSDLSGQTDKIVCRSAASGDVSCRSYYFDPAPLENALAGLAERIGASASTHAYLIDKSSHKVLWDYEDLDKWTLWQGKIKGAVGCRKHERGDRRRAK
jgi:hypothetical protein